MRKSNATSLIKSTMTSRIGLIAGAVLVLAALVAGVIKTQGTDQSTSKVIYVNANAGAEATGHSWTNAFRSPQHAFDEAVAGDTVWFAKGTYEANAGQVYEIPRGVSVYGGFAGTEVSLDQRDALANTTVFVVSGVEVATAGAGETVLDGIVIQGGAVSETIAYLPPVAFAAGDIHEIKIKYDAATTPLDCQIISEGEETVAVDVLSNADSINANYFILKGLGVLQNTDLLVWIDLDDNGTNMPVSGYSNIDADLTKENLEVNVNSGDTPSAIALAIQSALVGEPIFNTAAGAAVPNGSTFDITYTAVGAVEDLEVGISNHLFGSVTTQGDTGTPEGIQIAVSSQDGYVILQNLGVGANVELLVWVDLDDAGSLIPLAGYDNADADITKQNLEVTTVTNGMTAAQIAGEIASALQSDPEVIAAFGGSAADVSDYSDGDGVIVSGDNVIFTYNSTSQVTDVISPISGFLTATVTTQGGETEEISTVTFAAGETLKDILASAATFTFDDTVSNITFDLRSGVTYDLELTGYPIIVLTLPSATLREDVLEEVANTITNHTNAVGVSDDASTVTITNSSPGAATDITSTNPVIFSVNVTQQGGVFVKESVTITPTEVQQPADTIDGDSFLIATNEGSYSKIRVWFDVNNNGTTVTPAADERGLEVSSIVTGDSLVEIAAKIAYRLNLDTYLDATSSGTVVTILTVDPLGAVKDTVASPGTGAVDYTGTHLDVVTTDATGNIANVTFDAGTKTSNSGPHTYVEGSVLTLSIDESLAGGSQIFMGWRVEGGLPLATTPVFQYTLNGPVTLEAVYINSTDIIHVDANAGSDANGGTSWADAYQTLTYALQQEVLRDNPDDEIWMAAGRYVESVEMSNLQRVYGGFIGLAQDAGEVTGVIGETLRSERLFNSTADGLYLPVNETIMNPTGAHIVTASDDMLLDGIVIENGAAGAPGFPGNRGGGVFCTAGSPALVSCTLRGNIAGNPFLGYTGYGGALYALLGTPQVTNCLFDDNTAHRGGASYCDSLSFITFTDCVFRENMVYDSVFGVWTTESAPEPPPAPGWGGAIFNQGAALDITNCRFIGNYMNMCGDGGAIYNNSTDVNGNLVQITDCIFLRNKAQMHVIYNSASKELLSFNHGYGGAIYNRGSSPVITNSQFGADPVGDGNTSTRSGGAVCNAAGSRPTYDLCLFLNNHAFVKAGAVYNRDVETGGLFSSCTFTDNTAPYGGAVYNNGAQTQFVNSQFSGNECYESQILSWQKSSFVPGFMGSYAAIPASLTTVHAVADDIPDYFAGWSANQGTGVMPIITEPLPDWFGITGIPGTAVSTLPDVDGYWGGYGGSVFNDDASPTFTGCTFSDHEAISGAAMYNGRALISLDPAERSVEADEATSGPTETAGGTVAIVNSTFHNNHSVADGGAVFISKNYAVNISGTTFGDAGDAGKYNQAGALDDPTLAIIQDPSVVPLRDVYAYSGGWSELPPLPVGRKKGRVVRVSEGNQDWLYFIGGLGWNRDTYTDFVSPYIWKLNLKATGDGWIVVPDLQIPVHSGAAAYGGDGNIYIFGGYTEVAGNPTDQVQVLNLNGGSGSVVETWGTPITMPDVRAIHGAALVDTQIETADWRRIHLIGGTTNVIWTYWISGGPGANTWALSTDPAPTNSLQLVATPGAPTTGLTWAAANGTSVYALIDPVVGGGYRSYKAIDNWGNTNIDPPLVPNRQNRLVALTPTGYTNRAAAFAGGYANSGLVAVGGALDGDRGLVETLGDTTDAESKASTTAAAWAAGPAYPGVPWQQIGATSEGGSMHCAGGTGRVSPSAYGGAVYNGGGLLTISQSKFYNSRAYGTLPIPAGSGGALYSNNGGTVIIKEDTIIDASLAHSHGGGVASVGDVDISIENSIISNNIAGLIGLGQNGGGLYQVGTTGSAIIDNSTISGNHADLLGGGVHSATSILITNSRFTGNSVATDVPPPCQGGALDINGGEVISSTFNGNSATYYGGATDNDGDATFTGCEFTNNSVIFGVGGSSWGGTFISCVFKNNISAQGFAGGVSAASMEDCLLSGNVAGGNGGGAYFVVAERTIFVGNSAGSGGGADTSVLYECNLNNNSAGGGGGVAGTSTVINSLIYSNTAASGGGAYLAGSGALLELIHCTVTENTAQAAGGVYGFTDVNSESEALVRIRNSIVWDNRSLFLAADTFSSLHEMLTDDAQFDILYSCVRGRENGGISDGSGNIGLNAMDNPQFINPADENFRLSATSPCINIGTNDPAVVGYLVDIDYDGNSRPNQLVSDMGAYESLGNRPEIVVKGRGKEILSGDTTPDESDDTEFGFQDPNGHSNTVLTTNTIVYPNTGGAAVGASGTTLILDTTASSIDDTYNGYTVEITAGTGIGQIRLISDYVGSSRAITVPAWTTTPDTTSAYSIYLTDDKIQLASSESSLNDEYNGDILTIVSGGGVGQSREITDYDGATRIATLDTALSPGLSGSSQYRITTAISVAAGTTITLTNSASSVNDAYTGMYINVIDLRDPVSGIAVAATATTIQIAPTASSDDDYYIGCTMVITGGTGAGQEQIITDYDGTTKVVTTAAWAITPNTTSRYTVTPADDQPRLITSYDGTTKVATVDQAFVNVVLGTYQVYAGHWFTIENIGITDLQLTNTAPDFVIISQDGVLSVDFAVLVQPDFVIGSGDDTQFLIGYYPTPGGEELRTAQVLIANSDADEGLYLFTIGGDAVDPNPEIDIRGVDGSTIVAGEIGTDSLVGTDFGEVNWRTGTLSRVFEIHNIGGSDLTLSGDFSSYDSIRISGDTTDFTIITQPTNAAAQTYPITPGASYGLEISFDPSVIGQRKAVIEVLSDDSDEASYTFTVSGTGVGPQIKIISQSQELLNLNDLDLDGIAPDDTPDTPAAENFTNFGAVDLLVTSVTNTYELINSGTQTLTLLNSPLVEIREVTDPFNWPVDDAVIAALPLSTAFSVNAQPAKSVPPQLGTSFSIKYEPNSGTAESHYGIVRIISNDSTFLFRVSGENTLGNLPPTAVITTDVSANPTTGLYVVTPPVVVNVDGSGSTDPEGQVLTYSWTQPAGPVVLPIATPSLANTTIDFSAAVTGKYTFRLTVTDPLSGTPPALTDFAEIDFYVGAVPIFVVADVIWENDGVVNGQITDPTGLPLGNVTITETGDTLNRIVVSSPTDVGGNFTITVTDNTVADGDEDVTLTANASGITNDTVITVKDDESSVITIYGNGNEIEDGSTVVSADNFTYFGTVVPGGSSSQKQFVVANESPTTTLILTDTAPPIKRYVAISGTNAADFTVEYQPTGTVLPNGTNTFGITFAPVGTGLGIREALVTIYSNDSDRSPYTYVIKGNRGQSAEIDVQYGSGISIPSESTVPVVGNGTLFPTLAVGNVSPIHTFTIVNQGELLLTLTGDPVIYMTGDNEADFILDYSSIDTTLDSTSSTTTFTITFAPGDQGERNAIVWIPNSDSNEDPYWFHIRGNGFGVATEAPEIEVRGKGIEVVSGASAIEANGTDFGEIAAGETAAQTFTISNTSPDSQLSIGVVTSNSDIFTITAQPTDFTLDNGESTTITVEVAPTSIEGVTATITIPNNDPDEGPFSLVMDVNGGSSGEDFSAGDGGSGGSCSLGIGASSSGLLPLFLVLLGMISSRMHFRRKQ